jgi:hypothetical protein
MQWRLTLQSFPREDMVAKSIRLAHVNLRMSTKLGIKFSLDCAADETEVFASASACGWSLEVGIDDQANLRP